MDLITFCKKLSLDADKLAREFDLDDIEAFSPKAVARKVVEKVDKYRNFLESFLSADGGSFTVLTEIKALDMGKIAEIFTTINTITREFMLVDLKSTDEAFGEYVKNSVKDWEKVKPALVLIVQQAKDAWKDPVRIREELGYLG